MMFYASKGASSIHLTNIFYTSSIHRTIITLTSFLHLFFRCLAQRIFFIFFCFTKINTYKNRYKENDRFCIVLSYNVITTKGTKPSETTNKTDGAKPQKEEVIL